MAIARRLALPLILVAVVAAGGALAIASKKGDPPKTETNAAVTQYGTGGTGCSHGYWKNHHESWTGTGYSPSDNFDKVFGITKYGKLTLGGALELTGGGFNALAREAAAALLNSTTKTIEFKYTTAQVIEQVQKAVAANNPEPTKDALEGGNTSGCKLS